MARTTPIDFRTGFALVLFVSLFLAFAGAHADAPPPGAAATAAKIEAHPALWIAHGKRGTVYLLGSIHVLPPNLNWRTPEIAAAIGKADVFVFEIPSDDSAAAALRQMVAERGLLPAGQSLRAMLSSEGQSDLDKAVALAKLPPGAIDGDRPWLAGLTLTVARVMHDNDVSPDAGLDMVLAREAAARHKTLRYLETMQQQLDLLAPKNDDRLEIEEFQSDLKDFLTENDDVNMDKLLEAWASGDPARIDKLFNESLAKYPEARKTLIDDRNKAWIGKIEPMLDSEDNVFLITVGAGHLVGKDGVPNLLRKDGYKVDGP